MEQIRYSGKTITMTEALERAKAAGKNVTRPTLIRWIETHKLGHQPGGTDATWYVFEEPFMNFIYGKGERA